MNDEKTGIPEIPETPKFHFPIIPPTISPKLRDEISESLRGLESGEKTFDDLSPEVKKQLCAAAPFGFFVVAELMALENKTFEVYGDKIRKEAEKARKRRGEFSSVEASNAISRAVWEWVQAGSPGGKIDDATAGAFILDHFRQLIGNTNKNELRKIPVTEETRAIWNYLVINPSGMDEFTKRKNKIRRNKKYSYQSDALQLTIAGLDSYVAVAGDDAAKYAGTNVDARRIFTFTLERMNYTAQFRGGNVTGKISYTLQDLVDNGLYKSTVAARRGFLTGANILRGMGVGSAKDLHSKKAEKTDVEISSIFTGLSLRNGVCSITLNKENIFHAHDGGFSILPGYYYELEIRVGLLWDEISQLARQASNLRKLSEKAKFTISVKTLQADWKLPGIRDTKDRKKNRNPGRDIRGEIERVVSIALERNAKERNPDELKITISDEQNPQDFLAHGKITVELAGELLEYYKTVKDENDQKATDAIKAAKRRKIAAIKRNKAKAATTTQPTDGQPVTAQPSDAQPVESVSADKEKNSTTPKE